MEPHLPQPQAILLRALQMTHHHPLAPAGVRERLADATVVLAGGVVIHAGPVIKMLRTRLIFTYAPIRVPQRGNYTAAAFSPVLLFRATRCQIIAAGYYLTAHPSRSRARPLPPASSSRRCGNGSLAGAVGSGGWREDDLPAFGAEHAEEFAEQGQVMRQALMDEKDGTRDEATAEPG